MKAAKLPHREQMQKLSCGLPRLIAREQLGRRSPPRLVLEINMRKRLSATVADDKASGLFIDGPRRGKGRARLVVFAAPLSSSAHVESRKLRSQICSEIL